MSDSTVYPMFGESWSSRKPPTRSEPRRWVRESYLLEHPDAGLPGFPGWMWVTISGSIIAPALGRDRVVVLVPKDETTEVRDVE